MNGMLRKLLGLGPKVDLDELIRAQAIILDVRTRSEFNAGHVKGALLVPLDELRQHLSRIPRNKPVITCCASGMRSASAAGILRDHGFDAHNGGSWTSLQRRLSATTA